MYYTHPGCRTSIFGENRAYCIQDFTVCKLGAVEYVTVSGNLTEFPAVKEFKNRLRFDGIIVTIGWCVSLDIVQ